MLLCFAVDKCAVSPTGDRLYITSYWYNKLLTLARDGTLLATYTDPALGGPSGQVLVCGDWGNTVQQLATLATKEDGHHIIHHCGTGGEKQHPGVQSGILLLGRDNDAEDKVKETLYMAPDRRADGRKDGRTEGLSDNAKQYPSAYGRG
ncbi:hypothetical protein DPMN_053514 [Dreissena polymorpha]|uniref:Uncharacterized protein n=1 Tax=Dreissena polymorpha TaxID=45954 RepID=A0A9D4CLH4_DREPO|nr:hypothetical protein DPMN_053514 [Dreissena polymorpha]